MHVCRETPCGLTGAPLAYTADTAALRNNMLSRARMRHSALRGKQVFFVFFSAPVSTLEMMCVHLNSFCDFEVMKI